jgi:hypothetical protein
MRSLHSSDGSRRPGLVWAVLACLAFVAPARDPARADEAPPVLAVTPDTFLEVLARHRDAAGRLADPLILELAPGNYVLEPEPYRDPTCGNCEDPATLVEATVGLRLGGAGVFLRGASGRPEDVVLHTGAGYGLLFEDCRGPAGLTALTVTGGIRDPDGQATDAAVVVRRSQVTLTDCLIRDNVGDSTVVAATVVGIMGICGREGADLVIRNCRIIRNSWDGIALYREARATITDNLIDGVDKAHGGDNGGGRGVGIGVTWNARAVISGNRVTRYWKGIGVFVDAQADVQDNVIEEVLTWGIAYWAAGDGRPVARITGNAIFDTGACGIVIDRATTPGADEPPPGWCRDNLLVHTGQNPKYDDPDYYCRQCPLDLQAVPAGFAVLGNFGHDNRRAPDVGGIGDLDAATFAAAAAPILEKLHAVAAGPEGAALASSRFLQLWP